MEIWFGNANGQITESVRDTSVFSFPGDTKYAGGLSQNMVCALILWRSDLGLLMVKFRQYLK